MKLFILIVWTSNY